jgi:hypothetical protein
MGCSPFDFILSIEVDTPERTDLYQYLPSTFDSIPFLKYSSGVHIQGWFEIFDEAVTESVNFTLAANSLLRVISVPTAVGMTIGIQVTQGTKAITSADGSLLTILPASATPYSLQLIRPSGLADGTVVANIEIAIESNSAITQDIAGFSAPSTCSNSPFISQIVPNPQSGSYSSFNEFQVSEQSMESSTTLGSVQVILDQDSAFYAKVGSNFLLSDMKLTLTGQKNSDGTLINFVGRNGRNLNEINELVPAGTYSLAVTQR